MNFKHFFFLILIPFVLMGCDAQKLNPNVYERQWMMVAFKGYSKEFLMKNKAELNLASFQKNQNKYSAFMGCNQIFLEAKFYEKGSCEFSNIEMTEMGCLDKMQLESDFTKSLPNMKNYKIEGHFLTLSDEKGSKMKFVAADWD